MALPTLQTSSSSDSLPFLDGAQEDFDIVLSDDSDQETTQNILNLPFEEVLDQLAKDLDDEFDYDNPGAAPQQQQQQNVDFGRKYWAGEAAAGSSFHLAEYRIIKTSDPAIKQYETDIDGILQWVAERASRFAITMLSFKGVTSVVIFSDCELTLATCPTSLPVRLEVSAIKEFGFSFDNEPKNPWPVATLEPGASIGVGTAGTFGGVVNINSERWGVTAGHVLRQDQPEKKVIDKNLKVYQPAKKDATYNASAQMALTVLTLKYAAAIGVAKVALKYAQRLKEASSKEPQNEDLKSKAKTSKINAYELRSYFQIWNNRKESRKKAAKEVGKVKISIVRISKDAKIRSPMSEDWGLFKIGSEAKNQTLILGSEVDYSDTEELKPEMIVVKKGRSTGITVGIVNGVELIVKMERNRACTSEWAVLPAKDDQLPADLRENVSELKDIDGEPILRDIFGYVGDSGSLLINWETKKVVAMLIGGSLEKKTPVVYVTPIENILYWMKKELKHEDIKLEKTNLRSTEETKETEKVEKET